jgi:glycerate 2-kinase
MTNNRRMILETLFRAAVRAADPSVGMKKHLPQPPKSGRTVVIGAGKASAQMASALEELWHEPLHGLVVTRYGGGCVTKNIDIIEAAHPVPDAASLAAASRLFDTVSGLEESDLVIALISGGGSALLAAPPSTLSLSDEIALNEALLASGAPISAMNVVRKHFSTIKGGRLAAATRARVVSLVVSDVPGDNPAFVASGPTIPDLSTRQDAIDIVAQYRVPLSAAMTAHLHSPAAEAPRPADRVFSGHEHHVVASAGVSLEAAAQKARDLGISPVILSDSIEGEARDVALVHAAIAREISCRDRPFSRPVVLLSGGETTVTLRNGTGRGGRNGEFALALALSVDGHDIDGLAADTDGIDGTGENAGAFIDGASMRRLRAQGMDGRQLLSCNDSFSAFSAIGDLFVTGPTGTNVNDFRAIMILDGS